MQSESSDNRNSVSSSRQLESQVPLKPADQFVDGRFTQAFENALMGMAIIGTDRRLKRVNLALCEAVGYSADELIGKTLAGITHPDDLEREKALAASLYRGEIPAYKIEKRIFTKDGNLAWIDVAAFLIRDDQMKILYGLEMVENVTESKRAAEAIRLSEERYRSFVINSSEAIWRLEANPPIDTSLPVNEQIDRIYSSMYIAECNDAAARLYGRHHADDMLGSRLGDSNGQLKTGNSSSLRTFIKGGYRLRNKLLFGVAEKSQKRYLDSTVIGITMHGSLMRIWGVQRDETEQRVAQQKLKTSRQQLRSLAAHLQEVREQERANLAREMHDVLGQPLASIKIQLTNVQNALKARNTSDQNSALLKTLDSTTGLIEETLNSVRALATELRPGVLDKFGLVAAAEWQCQEFQRRTGINCKMRLIGEDTVLPSEVSTALFRILQEALSNVASHSDSTNCLVELRFSDRHVSLNVTDTGKGISNEQIASPTSLGLLGMRERAEMLGGKFFVRGNQGRGTSLSVQIRINTPRKNVQAMRAAGK